MKRIAVAAAAIAVFAAMCWDADRRVGAAYPGLVQCQADPARYAGRQIWIIPGKIARQDPEGFTLIHSTGAVRVRSTMAPPENEYVFLRGIFEKDGTVTATGIHVESRFPLKRWGVIGVSLITLFFFAVFFHRTFTWRAGALHARNG